MALSKLSGDEKRTIFVQLCDVFDPGVTVAFSSTSSELRELTMAERQQLQADHEAAAALARNARKGSCKRLREARDIGTDGLSSDDLATLGTLGSVLPALESYPCRCARQRRAAGAWGSPPKWHPCQRRGEGHRAAGWLTGWVLREGLMA